MYVRNSHPLGGAMGLMRTVNRQLTSDRGRREDGRVRVCAL